MPIHVALNHRSVYTYDRLVTHYPHIVRLRPAPHCRTPILSYSLKIDGCTPFLNWQQDPFSNYLARLSFPDPVKEFIVEVDLTAEMTVFNPFDFFLEESAENFPFSYDAATQKDLAPFLETGEMTPKLGEFHASVPRERQRTIDWLVAVNLRIAQQTNYLIRMEPGVQTPEETLVNASGSCRDTAWLLVQLLRHHGLAARFASGYLIQLKPDLQSLDGPSGTNVDFTDLHAWCEVYLPGAGWVGMDPTSGLFAGEGHIPLACTPEPSGAAPVTGATSPCEATFSHHMSITRILESPRVTKPYTEEQWQAIQALGKSVDEEFTAGDVRLTMGGEPTFVSIDNMDGDEWNFTAVGPEKRRLSGQLLQRLKKAFAPGGLLHHGQGKWYPGESLPRWSHGCWWRRDGQPIWQDDALLADITKDYGHTATEARRFVEALMETLGLTRRHIMTACEDVWYNLWRERKLPDNVDPLKSNLADKEERERLARTHTEGLDHITGYAVPLRRAKSGGWETGSWFLRREHLFLIPGDSPMGLRLPLDSLPWVEEKDYPRVQEKDPMEERGPLPPFFTPGVKYPGPASDEAPPAFEASADLFKSAEQELAELSGIPPVRLPSPVVENATSAARPDADPVESAPLPQESAVKIIRTALCAEARDGRIHLFIPPVEEAEDYLDLISAIESTAARLALPVVLEGSSPPFDPRLQNIKVTPDPGVIEVNMQPAASWDELVQNTTTIYEEARQTRLGTEKFMIDGRHVGTGGGNHIVIGGKTPADSPLLRRPDLLRSLLTFWQNHPSLSFLFSGLFIGPTSQHPRIDEARMDSLYELELAFKQIPESGPVPPWLVDRTFRHLLIDPTGNTHRAEFCIDKLFSPDSATGRLGLLELRAFEMPPHARMSLTQNLLLRALIARFWKTPLRGPLVRWGTELHDRFMLPHFVEQDLDDVLADLQAHGYPMEKSWFAPHLEFRFPVCGTLTQHGVEMEIRQALEPWHVLGESGGAGGAVRYVDSSLDRLQVKVRGLTGGRHVITCNGHALPLRSTGTNGEFIAGVRYRGWQPPECLHPNIPSHAPLVFDLVDTWNGRSLGGCTYHISHPGGRSYETLPVNSYEAESRRLARFFAHGHTPGPMQPAPAAVNREFPFTLDLRLFSRP